MYVCFYVFKGQGAVMSYLPSYTINVTNWSPQHRGRIIGIFQIPYQLGPMFISIIYNSFFVKGNEEQVMLQDLHGFFLCMSVMLGSLSLFGIIFTRKYHYMDNAKDNELSILIDHCSTENLNDQKETTVCTRFIRGMLHMDVQLIFWSQAITPIAGLVMLTNITAMLKSLGYISLSFAYTTAGPCLTFSVVLVVSFISDKCIHKISRVTISLILSIPSTLASLISIGYGHYLSILSIAYFLSLASMASSFCMLPTALTEKFDNSLFGYVFPFSCLATYIVNVVVQPLAGYLYDTQTQDEECWGAHCFHNILILVACIQLLGTIFHLLSISHSHYRCESRDPDVENNEM